MERRTLLRHASMAAAGLLVAGTRPPAASWLSAPSATGFQAAVLDGFRPERHQQGMVVSRIMDTPPASALAVQVPDGADGVWLRHLTAGRWTDWRWQVADEHGPDDPGSNRPAVSDLVWAPGTSAVQVAVTDGLPDVQVHVVNTLDPDSVATVGPVDDLVDAVHDLLGPDPDEDEHRQPPRMPTILRRADWEADDSWRRATPDEAVPTLAIVHHTVNSNSYPANHVPAILRAIYHYHVKTRRFDDIAYNFVIDRFGRIWEARAGGIGRGIVGAHARGHNTGSIGVALLGDHRSHHPSDASLAAIADLLAWKYHRHDMPHDPRARVTHGGHDLAVLSGHGDVGATACPGQRLHGELPALRRAIHARF